MSSASALQEWEEVLLGKHKAGAMPGMPRGSMHSPSCAEGRWGAFRWKKREREGFMLVVGKDNEKTQPSGAPVLERRSTNVLG